MKDGVGRGLTARMIFGVRRKSSQQTVLGTDQSPSTNGDLGRKPLHPGSMAPTEDRTTRPSYKNINYAYRGG